MKKERLFQRLFNPLSIAVIGASNDPMKPGGRVFKNIKENNYHGDLWPVNPKSDEIMGVTAFTDIQSLPAVPDLALIAIPATFVLDALSLLAAIGNKTVIILTAGFGEIDAKGKDLEDQILALADKNNMTIVGPNCSGFLTPAYAGKFAGIIPVLAHGKIDLISGSGATVDYLMEQAQTRGLKFSHVINLGNSIHLGVEDILELMDNNHNDESAKIILLYMEAVTKPLKLLCHARNLISKGCTLLGIKSGTTKAGAKAAASHTGAMTTSDNVVQALFEKAGIIRVESKIDLIETTCALVSMKKIPDGNKACIITDAGGPGVMLADKLQKSNISLPSLSADTVAKLGEVLPPQASLANPIDCLPSRNAAQIKAIFEILGDEETEKLDVIFFLTGNSGLSDNNEIYQAIAEAKKTCPIPIIPVFSSATTCSNLLAELTEKEFIYFHDEVTAGQAACRLIHRPKVELSEATPANYDYEKINRELNNKHGALTPDAAMNVLLSAGFSLPPQMVISSHDDLMTCCNTIGFPVVMKVVGPLHKSDVGGVKVNISNESEANDAWHDLMKIQDARGVMIQKMIDGVEVIIGAVKDGDFGHLLMFGLGGIYTEVFKDVVFSLATPLSFNEARQMIQKTRSYPILEGTRGGKSVCIDTLAENIIRLGRLVSDFPQISELDLNPIKGSGKNLYAVDARILID